MVAHMEALDQSYLIQLHTFLTSYLNEEELRDLCFQLGINYEDLGGTGRTARARELVQYCHRHGLIPELVQRCRALRPQAYAEISATAADIPLPGLKSRQSSGVASAALRSASAARREYATGAAIPPAWSSPPWKTILLIAGLSASIIVLVFVFRKLPLPSGSSLPPAAWSNAQSATSALPAGFEAFAGTWQISEQSANGSSLEHWNIVANHDQLTVEAFQQTVPGASLPSDYHEQLALSNIQGDGQTLRFIAKRATGVVTTYALTLVNADRIEGTYTSIDTTLQDSGMIQGDAGIIRDAGRVIMVRK